MAKAAVGLQPRPITPAGWAHRASSGQWVMAPHLDVFNRNLVAMASARAGGRSARLMAMMPPQHGKSSLFSQYFPGWWLGTFPADSIILSSYEADFAAKWGRKARDAFAEWGPKVFGIGLDPEVSAASSWKVAGQAGSMMTAGAGGAITGNPASLFLIDDPVKGMKEASSEIERENIWEWFTSVALTRMKRGSCMAMIYTPWHYDDLGQRIIAAGLAGNLEPWEVLRMPAIAETQDERDDWASRVGLPGGLPDPIGRRPGEPLWPELHPIEELEMRRRTDPYVFEALYQCRPRPKGGSFFRREWFERNRVRASDVPKDAERCRFWDKAASQGKGDWTVGVLMARTPDGRYFVEHVARDRLSAFRRDEKILATARDDERRGAVRIRGDQDPGSAGKAEAHAFGVMLDKYDVRTAPVSGDKETRARPFASSAEGGNVYLVDAEWNRAFLDELESFPKGKHDDIVDACSGAFTELAGRDDTLRVGENFLRGYRGRVSVA